MTPLDFCFINPLAKCSRCVKSEDIVQPEQVYDAVVILIFMEYFYGKNTIKSFSIHLNLIHACCVIQILAF